MRERRKLITAEVAGLQTGMPDRDAADRLLHSARARLIETERRGEEADKTELACAAAAVLAEVAPEWEPVSKASESVCKSWWRTKSSRSATRKRWLETEIACSVSWQTLR